MSIQWDKVQPEDFHVEFDVDQIRETGTFAEFAVRVYLGDELAFTKSVPLRLEFYKELKNEPDWKEQAVRVLLNRVKDDIRARMKQFKVPVRDKLDILDMGPQKIT